MTSSGSPATLAISDLTTNYALVDIWRVHRLNRKQFTFFSARHPTYSRIDYILLSSKITDMMQTTEIVYMSMSDHHATLCTLGFPNTPNWAPRRRFNLTLLWNEKYCEQFWSALQEFLYVNVRYLWDAIKGFIRNSTIAFASGLNKTHLKERTDLENAKARLIAEQQRHIDPKNESELSKVKVELNVTFLLHRARQIEYLDGS